MAEEAERTAPPPGMEEVAPAPQAMRPVEVLRQGVLAVSDRMESLALALLALVRERPLLAASLVAASAGALVGLLLAGLFPPRRPLTPIERVRRTVLERAEELRQRAPEVSIPAVPLPVVGRPRGLRWRAFMTLGPLAMRAMRYPVVRQLAWQALTSGVRRRFRR